MKNKILFIFFLAFTVLPLSAQEILVPLQTNPAVKKAYRQWHGKNTKSAFLQDTLSLPFLDDFSVYRVYPNPRLWSDRDAFINQTYGVSPPTLGVATLDAINEEGSLYPDASPFPFVADHLTSAPVNLDYSPGAKIFLSFYYQPQGLADHPEPEDSLCLDFFAPLQQRWITVWNTPGDSLQRDTATAFRVIILPVKDTAFLHNGFRFRFRNYASISSGQSDPGANDNCDQWNIDYVYLDKNRFIDDTIMHDVAIATPLKSVLKTFEAMPWRQFRVTFLSEMGSFLPVTYRNNDTIVRNVTRNFEIKDLYTGQISKTYTGGAVNVLPLKTDTYQSPLIYTFDSPAPDSVVFRIRSYLVTDNFDPKVNDTVTYYQVFKDYFAYDDGSAEAGYGLSGNGTINTAVAVRFHSYKTDTLQAVRIYFNESYQQVNKVTFNLMVWGDNQGTPGDVLYEKTSQVPVFQDSLNCFTTYTFDSAVVLPEGYFYVGWKQNSDVFLNIGFDRNRNNRDKTFIFFNGEWDSSSIPGTIMIRPVTGHRLLTSASPVYPGNRHWKVFPQPANDFLHIDFGKEKVQNPEYLIFNLSGQVVFHKKGLLPSIPVSCLHDGLYLLVIRQGNRPVYRTRVVIIH